MLTHSTVPRSRRSPLGSRHWQSTAGGFASTPALSNAELQIINFNLFKDLPGISLPPIAIRVGTDTLTLNRPPVQAYPATISLTPGELPTLAVIRQQNPNCLQRPDQSIVGFRTLVDD